MRLPLARYGLRELVIYGGMLAGAAVATGWFFPWVTPLFIIGLGFLLYFFRDPSREIPSEAGVLVAPADGRVTDIGECEVEHLGGKCRRVSIFLSIFDVHINRAPCSGRISSLEYHPGGFVNAMNPESARVNESNAVLLESDETPGLRVVVRQIAGIIARRIVCECSPGRRLARGERFGMIKFGSRTELCVPEGRLVELRVKVGDRVHAGKTVIGVIK